MKKAMLIILVLLEMGKSQAQNYVSGPIGLYSASFNAVTTIGNGGSVLVGTGGNWFLAGNITSADKGNPNSPSGTGRAETVTFDNTGTYSGAATMAGQAANGTNGYVVDGYVASTSNWTGAASPVFPTGNNTTSYPLSVPSGTAITAAYFDGSGSTQNKTVTGFSSTSTTEFSQYYDVPSGLGTGSYTLSYPSGLTSGNNSILSSGNTSATGTNGTTAYSLLTNISPLGTTASTTTAVLPATSATQVYLSSSSVILPITLINFTGAPSGCTANLAWTTALETNSSYYAVEAGLDGNNFSQLAKVASKNSITGASYTYSTALGIGTTYFRLKAVDLDNKFTYSSIIAISGACSTGLTFKTSPNPVLNVLNIQGLAVGNRISLINVSGQKLLEVTAGSIGESINMASYSKGVYIVRIQSADGTVNNIKVVKQ